MSQAQSSLFKFLKRSPASGSSPAGGGAGVSPASGTTASPGDDLAAPPAKLPRTTPSAGKRLSVEPGEKGAKRKAEVEESASAGSDLHTPVGANQSTSPLSNAPTARPAAKKAAPLKQAPTPPEAPPARESPAPRVSETRELSYKFIKDPRDLNQRRPDEPGYDPTTLSVRIGKGEKSLTPAMEQYWEIKKTNADMILFFKVGKFYELFEADALIGHRELQLAFMGKEAPHVGFPEAQMQKYSEKLVQAGHKVGVVEQMETPKELAERNANKKKGVPKEKAVRRELCEVHTAGTAPNEKEEATYLLVVSEDVQARTHPLLARAPPPSC